MKSMEESMDDRVLLNIALITMIIGLVSIFLLMMIGNPKNIDITSINDSYISKRVAITGLLKNARYSNKTLSMTIAQECTINAVVFQNKINSDKNLINILVPNISTIKIEGKIGEYNGDYQIIVDKIEIENYTKISNYTRN
jgi:hypothetical protein